MCSCAQTNNGAQRRSSNRTSQNIAPEECEYTIPILQDWLAKAKCFKEKGLYVTIPSITKNIVNAYIGILASAVKKKNKPCYYQNKLEEIQGFIIIATTTGLC